MRKTTSIYILDALSPDRLLALNQLDDHSEVDKLMEMLLLVESSRFLRLRTNIPKSSEFARNYFFQQPDDEFRQLVRVSKPAFHHVLAMIEGNQVFHNESHNDQAPVWLQLAVALDRLGNYGNGVSLGRTFKLWGIGKGTAVLYTDRVISALNDFAHEEIKWPTRRERAMMSRRMAKKGFRGCVGFIDGTTIPFAQKPGVDGECFFDRKHRYSLNAQVVCDDRRRIIALYSGWPGSCADSTVYRKMQLAQDSNKARFFSPGEYLIADSAYPADKTHSTLVPSYKSNMRGKENSAFNTCVAHVRVVNEHTIGVWKCRFSSLREIRIQIRKKEDSIRVLRWITACAVLHNVLIDFGDIWTEDVDVDEDHEEDNDVDGPDDVEESFPFRQRLKKCAIAHHRRPGGILWYRSKKD